MLCVERQLGYTLSSWSARLRHSIFQSTISKRIALANENISSQEEKNHHRTFRICKVWMSEIILEFDGKNGLVVSNCKITSKTYMKNNQFNDSHENEIDASLARQCKFNKEKNIEHTFWLILKLKWKRDIN